MDEPKKEMFEPRSKIIEKYKDKAFNKVCENLKAGIRLVKEGGQGTGFISRDQMTAGTLLMDKSIADAIIMATEKKLIPTELAAIRFGSEVRGSDITINIEDFDAMTVREIAEGTNIWRTQDTFSSTTITPKKYGGSVEISMEAEEDGKFALVEMNLKRLGREFAENVNSLIVTVLDGAATTISGGATLTIPNLNTAIKNLRDYYFEATDFIMGSDQAQDLSNIDTFFEADKAGTTDLLRKGILGNILGLVLHLATGAGMTSTSGYVLDRSQAFAMFEKRGITTKEAENSDNDTRRVNVTQRIAFGLLRSRAVNKITTS